MLTGITRGWILAGGRSTRFGSDKAVHRVDGVPMVVRLARVLQDAGLEPIVVAREARGLGLAERMEPDGPRHPLHGVASVLGEGDALFCPCDLPDLTAEQVRALLRAAETLGPVVALGQPLLAVLPASLQPRAASLAAAGGRVRALVDGLPTVDLGPLVNLNRPDGAGPR